MSNKGRRHKTSPSIGCGRGERRRGKANATVSSIEDGIEPLKERVAVDKVEARSGGRTDVVDDEVDIARSPANQRIQRTWPDLSVRGQLERGASCREHQRLKVAILSRSNLEQARGVVEDRSRRRFVPVERVCE